MQNNQFQQQQQQLQQQPQQQQQNMKKVDKKSKKPKDFTPIYVWGSDAYGQLGLASREFGKSCPSPRFTSFSVIIEDIACGEEHTSFIAQNGYVYSMGNNNQGQLGVSVDESYYKSAPTLVEGLKGYKAIQISCGAFHTAAVCDNGQLFTWGQNCEGQLGIGRSDNMTTPQIVDLKNNLAGFVSCGKRNTMVITQNQKVFGFGDGKCGQLGLGNESNEYKPKQLQLPFQDIIAISCGDSHTLFLTEEGEAYSCGNNTYNQLGCINNSQSSNVAVKVKQKSHQKFVKVIAGHTPMSAALSSLGNLYLWGTGFFGQFDRPTRCEFTPKDLLDFSVGSQFICLLDGQGKVYSWGSNMFGELGQGAANGQSAHEPIQVEKIKDKNVKRLYSGATFVFAMGENWVHQQLDMSGYDSKDKDNSKLSNSFTSKRGSNPGEAGAENLKNKNNNSKNNMQMDILRKMSDTPYFEDVIIQQQHQQQLNQQSIDYSSKMRQSTSNFPQQQSSTFSTSQQQAQTQQQKQLQKNNQFEQHQDNFRVYSEQSFQEKKTGISNQPQKQFNQDQYYNQQDGFFENYDDNNETNLHANNNIFNNTQDTSAKKYFAYEKQQQQQNAQYSREPSPIQHQQQYSEKKYQFSDKKQPIEYGVEQFETYHDQNSASKYSHTGKKVLEDQDESYFSREQSPIMNKENMNTDNKSLKHQYRAQQYSSHKKANNPSPNQLSFDDSQIYEPIDYNNLISDSKQSKPNSVQKQSHTSMNHKGTSLITYNKPIPPSVSHNSKDSSLQGTIQLNNYLTSQIQSFKNNPNSNNNNYPNYPRERSYSTQQNNSNYSFLQANNAKGMSKKEESEDGLNIFEVKYKQLKLKYERSRMERDEYHDKLKYEREVNKNLLIRLERKTKKQRELEKRLEFLNMDLQMNKRTYDMKIEELLKKLASYESKIETKQYKELNFLKSYDESAIDKSTNRNLSEINSQIINLNHNNNKMNEFENNNSQISESYHIVMKDETPSKMLKNKNQMVSFSPLNQSDFSAIDQHNTTVNSKLNQTGNMFNNTNSTLNNTLAQINNQNQNFVEDILEKYNKRQQNKQNPLLEKIANNSRKAHPLGKKDLNVNTEIDFTRQYKTLKTCPNTYNNCSSTTSNSYNNNSNNNNHYMRNNIFSQPYSTKQSSYTRPSSTTAHNSTFTDKFSHNRAQSSLAHQYRYKASDKTYF